MSDRAPLPQLVNEVGDRIGLNYNIERKSATRKYIDNYQTSHRLDFDQLRNSVYTLNEARTKKKSLKDRDKSKCSFRAKNPLRLNCKIRKTLYKLTPEEKVKLRYSTFEKVNELWKQYSSQVLRDQTRIDPMALFRMDLHGAKIKCIASRNPTLIGVEGFVVQETKNTFLIITITNSIKTVPKRECLFELIIGKNIYSIHGCNMLMTTQARCKVKCKQKKCLSEV